MTIRPDVCPQCPFRRKSPPGYLGNNHAAPFLNAALTDEGIGCHMLIDQTLPRQQWIEAEAAAPRCRGAMIMCNNQFKEPRSKEAQREFRKVERDPAIFQWNEEFIYHHCGGREANPAGQFELVPTYTSGNMAARTIRARTRKAARAIAARLMDTGHFQCVQMRHWRTSRGQNTYIVLHSEFLNEGSKPAKDNAGA